jgi:hypothetical protein
MQSLFYIAAIMIGLLLGGCLKTSKQSPKQPSKPVYQGQAFKPSYFNAENLAFSLDINKIPLAPKSTFTQQKDTLWALSHTDRFNNYKGQALAHLITQKGVLPQALVPLVRQEIKENKLLSSLLGSFLGNLTRVFADAFFQDSQLSSMLRKTLSDRIAKVFPTSIATSLPWRLDLFTPHQAHSKSMLLDDQAVLWHLGFSLSTMWQDPKDALWQNDHGLQLVWLSRIITEWSYIYGIETSGFGGLSFDPKAAQAANVELGPYDPRVAVDPIRVIGGEYAISIPAASTFGLALEARESWQRTAGALTLGEQSRMLQAFSRAYKRLRPSARKAHMQPLYTHVLPDSVHEMAFVFIAGFADILQHHLTNKEDNTLYEDSTRTRPAEFLSLVRLASASDILLEALKDYENDKLSPPTKKLVEENISILKEISRLAVQSIFFSYVTAHDERTQSIAFHDSVKTSSILEALMVLNKLDQKHFDFVSEIRLKIISLNHWFVQHRLSQHTGWTLADLSFLYETARSLKSFGQDTHKAPWLDAFYEDLDNKITAIEESSR